MKKAKREAAAQPARPELSGKTVFFSAKRQAVWFEKTAPAVARQQVVHPLRGGMEPEIFSLEPDEHVSRCRDMITANTLFVSMSGHTFARMPTLSLPSGGIVRTCRGLWSIRRHPAERTGKGG